MLACSLTFCLAIAGIVSFRRRVNPAFLALLCTMGFGPAFAAAQTVYVDQLLGSGLSRPYDVAIDANGNLFVSDYGHSAVKEILAAGGYTTVNTLGGNIADPQGLTVDASDNVFVADASGVQEIVAAGGYTTVKTLSSVFSSPQGVAVDTNGNVFVADTGHSTVAEILASGGYTTVTSVGSGFVDPRGVAVDAAGDVFVSDANGVEEVPVSGGYTKIQQLGSGFRNPSSLAVDSSGNVFVADTGNSAVKEILAAGGYSSVTTVFSGPASLTGVAVDSIGRVFLAASQESTIGEILQGEVSFGSVAVKSPVTETLSFNFPSSETVAVPLVVTQGAQNLDFTDAGSGTCTTRGSGFVYPAGGSCTVDVKFDPLYPGDRYGAVQLATTTGVALATVYLGGSGTGPQIIFRGEGSLLDDYVSSNGSPTVLGGGYQFSAPFGVAVDASGNVYVTDWGVSAVKEITAASGYRTVESLGGTFGFSGPSGVALDGAGNIFIADTGNNAVEEMSAGCISASCVTTLSTDFNHPSGVAVDGSGNVFVADTDDQAVKEILASSGYATVKTLGGPEASTYFSGEESIASGPGNGAVAGPTGVSVDGSGNVYVVDMDNPFYSSESLVVELRASGGYSTPTVLSQNYQSQALAVDTEGNIWIAGADGVLELPDEIVNGDFSYSRGVAVDEKGNLFIATDTNGKVEEVDFSDPPSLSFALTMPGLTSTDSPRTITVANYGNRPLTFNLPVTGTNPSVAANFAWDSGSTMEQTNSNSPAAFTLSQDDSRTVAIDFKPSQSGTIAGSVVFTDNDLNASPGTTQEILLSGTAAKPSQLAFGVPPYASIAAGGNTGSISVDEQDSGGQVVPGSTDVITLTVTGPDGYLQSYTAAAENGVAMFNLNGDTLITPGVYTYTASSPSLSSVGAIETVTISSATLPATSVGTASATQTATMYLSSSFTLGSIGVLTRGTANLDFQLAHGGTCTVGTAYAAGSTCTVNYTFDPTHPGPRYGAVVVYDNASPAHAEATDYLQGTGEAPQIAFRSAKDQKTIVSGMTYEPLGVAADESGNVFVTNGSSIEELLAAGGSSTLQTPAGALSSPSSLAIDGAGNIFVADQGDNTLKEVIAGGGFTTVKTLLNGLSDPTGVAVDGSGNVFVADSGNNAVKELMAIDGYTTVNSLGSGFLRPDGVAVDGSGNVFVADFGNSSIKELSAASGYTTVTTLNNNIPNPFSVIVDTSENVFVTDPLGGEVNEISVADGYSTVQPLGGGFIRPQAIALNGSGNVFVGDAGNNSVQELDFSDAPSLSFATTVAGSASGDSPQTVIVTNDGNQTLNFSGVSYPTDFPEAPGVATDCSASTNLSSGASCTLSVDFLPRVASVIGTTAALSESVSLADNALNETAAGQSLMTNGTAVVQPTQLAFATPPTTIIAAGSNAGSAVTVEEQDGNGDLIQGVTDAITLTVSGPNDYSKTYTVSSANGVATFNLSGVALTTAGTYTYTATFTGLTGAMAQETVVADAYTDPTTNVGTATPTQTATLYLGSSFTLGSIAVLTQGAPNLDFQVATGGTCTVGATYSTGDACTVNYTFNPTHPGPRYGAVVLYDNASPADAIATVYLQGTGDGPQVIFPSNNQQTIVGTAGLSNSVAVDGSGNVFFSDNSTLKEALATGGYTVVRTISSAVTNPDIAVDGAGNLFVTDNNAIKEFLAAGGYTAVKTLETDYQAPAGIAVDGAGNLYIAESTTGAVDEIMAAGSYTTVKQLATGIGLPAGVAVDGSGNVFVADVTNNAIDEFTAASGYATKETLGSGFSRPTGVAVDESGNVFVADFGNSEVKEILADGGYETANTLVSGSERPVALALDGSGNVFISGKSATAGIYELNLSQPPSLSFAGTAVGSTSTDSPQTFTVANDGNAPLTFSDLSVSANWTAATGGSYCSSTSNLVAGGSCSIAVGFSPLAPGTPLTGGVTLTDNAPGSPQQIALSGTATQQTLSISVTPTEITILYGTSPSVLTASVSFDGTAAPTGAVTFTVDNVDPILATCTGTTSPLTCKAAYPSGTLSASTHYISASIASDQDYAGATGRGTLIVLPAAKSIVFPSMASPVAVNATATLAATTSSGDPVLYTVTAGSASITGTNITYTNAGQVTITASSPASANYLAAAPVSQTIQVNPAPSYYIAPTEPVSTSSEVQTATVNFTTAGTPANIAVLTQGAPGLDFNLAAGGTCTDNVAYTAGQACSVGYTFKPQYAGIRYGAIVLTDSGGSVLGEALLSGTGSGPQMVFPNNSTVNLLGSGFSAPFRVAVDSSGNIFVADYGNNAVKEIVAVNGQVSSNSTVNTLGRGFNHPEGVALDGAGDVFVADTGNNVVKEIVALNGQLSSTSTVITVGSGFSSPNAVTVDGAGDVFVADVGNNAVKEIVAVNGQVSSSSTINTVGSGFNQPIGVAVDGAGDVFVADNGNNAVKEIVAVNGQVSSTSPVNTVGSGFHYPADVAVDAAGDVFVADQFNNAVKEILAVTGQVSSSSTVLMLAGGFSYPYGVAVDGAGDLLVADLGNKSVKELPLATAPSLSFAPTAVGTISADSPQTVTVQNDGNASLNFSGLTASANWAVDTSGTNCSPGSSLREGGICSVPISFSPQALGTPLKGDVTLTDNAPGSSQQIALTGTATQQTPVITVSPASINYSSGPTTLSASVSFVGSTVPTGAVTFSVDGGAAVAATCTGTSSPLSCAASYPTGAVSVPTHTIQVMIASDTNFTSASGTATLTVSPIAPTICFTVANHTYGDAAVTLAATSNSSGSFTYSVVSGPATISGSKLTITSAGQVTVEASEAANGNYIAGTLNASFAVSQAQLGVAITGTPTKTYDATTAAALTPANFAVTGLVGSDSITINQPAGSYASANAGAETVTVNLAPANFAAASGLLSNYILPTSATGTGIIKQAVAAVTPNSATKVYGTADPALTGTLTGFVAADNVTASYARTAGETVLGGPYAISAALAPAAVLSNYNITYNTAPFTITAAPASVTPNGASKVYGTADPVLTGTLMGFLPADKVVATYTRAAGETVLAGPYAISATLAPAAVLSNYTVTYNTALFTITPAKVTVNFGNIVQTYTGGPLAPTVTTVPAGVSYSVASAPDIAAGSYPVTATVTDPNYVGSGSTTFTILQAPASIALSNLSQVYSGSPESATATVTPAYCGPAAITYNGAAAAPSNIGTYPVVATMANPNCTAPNATGTLIINAFAASSCVYALNPTAHSALSVSDGSSLTAQCSIQVNSSARDAFDVDGHGTTVNATAISVVGGAAVDRFTTVSTAPATGQRVAADPLAAVVAPIVGTCINAGNHGWDGDRDDGYGPRTKAITLNPGTYCGGIAIHTRSTVTFNPGTYILLGGGLTIDGGAQVTGTGVTFYNTADRMHPYQPVRIDGGSKTTLSAPLSGPLAGVLFFQDRNLAQKDADHDHNHHNDNDNHAHPNVITGNTESTFAGALYFPTTALVYSGGADQDPGAYTLIVADTISVAAHSNVSLTVLGKPMSDNDACSQGPGKDCDHDKDGDHNDRH